MARPLGLLVLLLPLALVPGPRGAGAQVFTPQLASGLSVSYQTQTLGGSRILVLGEVRNSSASAYDHVVLLAEGLDERGRVVSRGRAYLPEVVPARGRAAFQLRLLSGGTERRYRVEVEAYQVAWPGGGQSP